jgi:hypothetical protein
MPHTAFYGTDAGHRGILRSEEWSLSVGAGICKGILPEWPELAFDVLNKCSGTNLTQAEFDQLKQKTAWGLDAWLQAGMNLPIKSKQPDPFSMYYDSLPRVGQYRALAVAPAVTNPDRHFRALDGRRVAAVVNHRRPARLAQAVHHFDSIQLLGAFAA